MKKFMVIIILTLSVNAMACDGACREPSVIGTTVSNDLKSDIKNLSAIALVEFGDQFCGYIDNNGPALLLEAINELNPSEQEFTYIHERTLCRGNRTILWLAIEKGAILNDLNFVKIVLGQFNKEGGRDLIKKKLNEKDFTGESIIEFANKQVETATGDRKLKWQKMRDFIIPFS